MVRLALWNDDGTHVHTNTASEPSAYARLGGQSPRGIRNVAAHGGQGRDGGVLLVPSLHGQASQGDSLKLLL